MQLTLPQNKYFSSKAKYFNSLIELWESSLLICGSSLENGVQIKKNVTDSQSFTEVLSTKNLSNSNSTSSKLPNSPKTKPCEFDVKW